MSSSPASATPYSGAAEASRSGKLLESTTMGCAPACPAPSRASAANVCQAKTSPALESPT